MNHYYYFNYKRTGCYIIQKYKKNGRAVIVDAHDERVATKPCDMVRPHPNQEIPVNIAVKSKHSTGADILKKKPKPKKKAKKKSKNPKSNKAKNKSEMSDDDNIDNISIDSGVDQNCRSRIIANETQLLNEGDPKTNICNVDCSKCDECLRIKKYQEKTMFTQV